MLNLYKASICLQCDVCERETSQIFTSILKYGAPILVMSLAEQLRRAQELTTQMVGVLDAFDRRLENLQQTIAPVHSVTKKLTTVSLSELKVESNVNYSDAVFSRRGAGLLAAQPDRRLL